jgi:hypothetical protein
MEPPQNAAIGEVFDRYGRFLARDLQPAIAACAAPVLLLRKARRFDGVIILTLVGVEQG